MLLIFNNPPIRLVQNSLEAVESIYFNPDFAKIRRHSNCPNRNCDLVAIIQHHMHIITPSGTHIPLGSARPAVLSSHEFLSVGPQIRT